MIFAVSSKKIRVSLQDIRLKYLILSSQSTSLIVFFSLEVQYKQPRFLLRYNLASRIKPANKTWVLLKQFTGSLNLLVTQ